MKTNRRSESGALNPRVFTALILCLSGVLVTMLSFAQAPTVGPSPSSGTLSVSNPKVTYTDPVGPVENATGEGVGFSAPTCAANGVDCSSYVLTLDPSIFTASGNYDPSKNSVVIQLSWSPSANQYGSFVEDKNGNVIATNTAGLDPETITIPVNTPGLSSSGPYTIVTTLEIGSPGTGYTATVTLAAISGAANASASPAPRYQTYINPGVQTSNSGLEPSIGVDWNPNVASLQKTAPGNASVGPTSLNTGGITMFTETFDQYRVGFDDCSSPAINTWDNIAFIVQQTTTLDAIGFTDHFIPGELGTSYPPPKTPGRTFHGELTAGDSNMSYSDDDGATHTQTQGGGIPQGPDHETVGGGPYNPNSVPPPPPNAVYPNAIYYCTQNIVAEAECSRSDDGGLTFGPGVPIYQNAQQCIGSIHGHVKVARDGTVYVPNYSCTISGVGNQGVAVSTDNGLTWTERNVPGSGSPKPGLVDPSVGIGLNDVGKATGQTTNTIYFGYIDSDGGPKIAQSHDRGVTWSTPQNVGATFNIANSTFPVVVAGDDNRAAFGFLGTTTLGNSSTDPNFAGVWHLYIATTYDGGNSWITIDATPDNPVQVGPVCNAGTGCSTNRNLLDFNGFDVDSQGRGLVGITYGCLNCTNSSPASDSTSAQAAVVRQSGGPRLFKQFDPVEPAAPAAPQAVSATKQSSPAGVLVSWLEPDNGGSAITSYNIYRGTTSGTETLLASVQNSPTNTQTKYLDTTATGPSYFYHVTAVNAQGESGFCEELSLGVSTCPLGQGSPCASPYVTVGCAGGPGNVPTDPTSGELTIENVSIGEPFTSCADNSLTFVMQVQTLDPSGTGNTVLPANSEWQILFGVTDTNGKPETVYVDINTISPNSPATPGVDIGRRDPTTTGTLDTAVCTASATSSCPQISATTSPGGTITFKLNAATPISFGAPTGATGVAFNWDASKVGTQLGAIEGNTFLLAGAGAGFLETIQTTGAKGTYTRVGNISCSDKPPIAILSANPMSGNAPLAVTFDASQSNEPAGSCGTINSYTLDFGDGSALVTQSSPTFTHSYTNAGSYPARLTVSDTVGQTSTNPAQQVITVNASTPNLSISAFPSQIAEGSSATYALYVSPAPSKSITVKYSMSGIAKQGPDYTLSGAKGQVTIPAGQSSASVQLTALKDNDEKNEKAQTAIMTLKAGAGYKLVSPTSATVTITP